MAYLLYLAWESGGWELLLRQEQNTAMLLLATVTISFGIVAAFVRMYVICAALNIRISFVEAMKMGVSGYALGFVTIGELGSDVFKMGYLYQRGGSNLGAISTSIVADRVSGVLGLMTATVFGWIYYLVYHDTNNEMHQLITIAGYAAAIGLVVGVIVTAISMAVASRFKNPDSTAAKEPNGLLDRIRDTLLSFVVAYRELMKKPFALLFTYVSSVAIHVTQAIGYYFIFVGLRLPTPAISEFYLLVPVTTWTGLAPIPGGMGAFDATFSYLLSGITDASVTVGQVGLVCIGVRLINILFIVIGLICYASLGKTPAVEQSEQ